MTETEQAPPGVDPTRPSPARLYDYYLGGTTNYAVDRAAAAKLKVAVPDLIDAVWAKRGFHGRASVWLAEHGIRQFIDIGSGLPTQNNTHEAVHKVPPEARVVYVDIGPIVAAHAGALLAEDGTTTVITADLRDPDALLGQPALRELRSTDPAYLRPRAAVERFFDGLELVPPYLGAAPAVTYVGVRGAEDPAAADSDGSRGFYCGVARRPGGLR